MPVWSPEQTPRVPHLKACPTKVGFLSPVLEAGLKPFSVGTRCSCGAASQTSEAQMDRAARG